MEVSNNDGSESPNSSNSDEQHDDELLQNEITTIKDKLQSSPYSYNDHVQLITLYRQAGDLDGARTARSNMAELFPLSESLWLEWIQDELPLSSIEDGIQDIQSLFDRAVEDYTSVQLWIEYCTFALDKMTEMGGVSFVREIFSKALMSIGLHTAEGGLCWNMYREFEKTVFQSLQEMQANDDEDLELKQQVEAQYERVDKLFKRHLGVPVCGIDEVLTEYQSFSDTVVTEESLPTYARAVTRLKILLPFEEELSSSQQSLEVYKKYIDELKKTKEEQTLINVVFQRALADHPLQSDLWTQYIEFLNTNFAGVGSVLLKGHKQAVRNCPWIKDFWISFVQAQEKMGVAHNKIIATLDQSVSDNYSDSQPYLELWICYCDYLRRQTVDSGEAEINDLRRLFRRAREHLDTYFGSNGDPTDSLSLYQASLEARCYSNMEEARLLWTDVMKRHGKETEYWIQYAQLERVYGDIPLCRKILLMGVNSANDNPDRICNELLQFEREQGTLDTYKQAMERCSSQLTRIKQRRDKAVEKEFMKKDERKQQRKERRKVAKETTAGKRGNEATSSENVAGKRKRQSHTIIFYNGGREPEGTVKKQKVDNTSSSTDNFVPAETEKMEVQPSASLVEGKEEEDEARERYDPLKWLAREDGNDGGGSDKKNIQRENNEETVFVSNLAFNTTEDQLRDIFQNCGEISDIRLIKTRKTGSVNVFAYIEYTSIEPVEQALLLDRQVLNHRPMFVSKDRKRNVPQTRDTKPKYSDASTIYITNIPFNVKEEQLMETFKEAGDIKEVRLVRNIQGRSKGFAYIEYTNESSTSKAVMKLDQCTLQGRKLNVSLSKPPPSSSAARSTTGKSQSRLEGRQSRSEDVNQPFTTTSTLSLGGRQRISMMPRVIAKRDASSTVVKEAETGIKKSNEDFRNMLLKKN